MFSNRTVFVVGAGASHEVGLPVGERLKGIIADKLDLDVQRGRGCVSGDKNIFSTLINLRDENGLTPNIDPYLWAGRDVAKAMPSALSIDNYLHTHSEDARIVLMGKLGIAASILEAEHNSKIYLDPDADGPLDFREIKDDSWHNTFCKMAHANVALRDIDTIFDNVSIITFNYDRCIEHYVANSLANYLRMSLEEAQQLTQQLEIIHPYGQVGRLPWQNPIDGGCAYGQTANWNLLLTAAKQLRTFTERVEQETVLDTMRDRLTRAQCVVFLGFSYGDMNMELMTMDNGGLRRRVFGTSIGMSVPNTDAAKAAISKNFSPEGFSHIETVDLVPLTCNGLLTDYWKPILQPIAG